MGVFGSSLDYGSILLSDASGLGGRPLTVAVQLPPLGSPSWTIIVINAGTFAPPPNLLIHELTHAGQSQHAIDPTAFMKNSIESQEIAETLNALGADASAYYFRPGRSFSRYGAEQIACQVEKGYSAIVSSVRSVPAFVTHPGNNIGLELPHWEVMGPGIDSR